VGRLRFPWSQDRRLQRGGTVRATASLTPRPAKDVASRPRVVQILIDPTAGYYDTGAIYDLRSRRKNACARWANGTTWSFVTCDGQVIAVEVNGEAVNKGGLAIHGRQGARRQRAQVRHRVLRTTRGKATFGLRITGRLAVQERETAAARGEGANARPRRRFRSVRENGGRDCERATNPGADVTDRLRVGGHSPRAPQERRDAPHGQRAGINGC